MMVLPFLLVGVLLLYYYSHVSDRESNITRLWRPPIINYKNPVLESYFSHKFQYYDKLPANLKSVFLYRVNQFISEKRFHGRDEFEITGEVKAQIAGAAIQLTLGLKDFSFSYFKNIFVYPDVYRSPVTGNFHKGETNLNGAIVLSWKDFVKGYNIPDDKLNLGLHEMAHALELDMRIGKDPNTFFYNYFYKWDKVSLGEYKKVRDYEGSILRDYGGENLREFFAVCIEHFFEASAEFKEKLPEIYNHLSILLNQDPLAPDLKVKFANLKSKNEILHEIEYLTPQYSTGFFIKPSFIIMTVLISWFIYGIFPSPPRFTGYFGFFIALAILYIQPVISGMRKIIIHDKYLSVKNFWTKKVFVVPLSQIVKVTIENKTRNREIEIVSLDNSEIVKTSFRFNGSPRDEESINKLLREKGLVVLR